MAVDKPDIYEPGLYFLTFTNYKWLPLISLTNSYDLVYKWFDHLKGKGHHIAGYVIMPNHVHALIGFAKCQSSINKTVCNGKRFIAYDIIASPRCETRGLREYHATLVPLKTNLHGAVPSKIFMAMANAIPVFFSGSGEGARIIKEGKIGWVNAPSDFAALSQDILKMVVMCDKDYEQMRTNCKQLRKVRFNKETQDAAFDLFLQGLNE